MNHPLYTQCLITADTSVRQALNRINSLHDVPLTLLVIDSENHLLGTLTDGDIRRGLLSGASLNSAVTDIMHRNYKAITPVADADEVLAEARRLALLLIPVIDSAGHLSEIIDLRYHHEPLPIDAVLMAGGRGERLRPLTLTTPKPLLPVGNKAIIDHNVDALADCGVKNIFVTVNYLHTLIEDHFTTRHPEGVNIRCIREPRFLGTFGSIGLINELQSDHVLVMNSDLLTDIDFRRMYKHHLTAEADMTIATIPYTVCVPYAILETKNGRCTSLQEKPSYNYLANAGVYIVKRSRLATITGSARIDATEFIEALLSDSSAKVITHPVDGTWIDIGSPSDYQAACMRMSSHQP